MGGLLMALRVRGERSTRSPGRPAMREKMLGVWAPADAIDVVGTGGDASGSFNISTCAALIVAGVVFRWPSTAIVRSHRGQARPTCWRHSA